VAGGGGGGGDGAVGFGRREGGENSQSEKCEPGEVCPEGMREARCCLLANYCSSFLLSLL